MTEHEKMLLGYTMYDPFTENMAEERTKAHRLCKLYNDLFDTETDKRNAILDELLPDHGEGVYLQGPIYFDFGLNTKIGKGSYANFNFTVLDEGRVTIGENVFIGPNVSLVTAIHPLRYQERNLFFNEKTGCITNLEYTAPITIEDNCWIAANVTIVGGVKIGFGSVIGAGSVVTKDIPPHSLAVGNPCRVLRQITDEDSVELFLQRKREEKGL